MKKLAILVGAVLLLISAWLIFGRRNAGDLSPSESIRLHESDVPLENIGTSDLKDSPSVDRSVHDLLEASRNRPRALECVEFLKFLFDSLGDDQWARSSKDLVRAWEKLASYPEAQDR